MVLKPSLRPLLNELQKGTIARQVQAIWLTAVELSEAIRGAEASADCQTSIENHSSFIRDVCHQFDLIESGQVREPSLCIGHVPRTSTDTPKGCVRTLIGSGVKGSTAVARSPQEWWAQNAAVVFGRGCMAAGTEPSFRRSAHFCCFVCPLCM